MGFLHVLLFAGTVSALPSSPAIPPSIQNVVCAAENAILSKLTAVPTIRTSALAFCSSYIKVAPATTTVIVATVTPVITVTETTSTAITFVKRAVQPTPTCLNGLAAPLISQACSCISNQISIATVTVPATATASTSTVVAVPTQTCSATPLSDGGQSDYCDAANDHGPSVSYTFTTCPGICYDLSIQYSYSSPNGYPVIVTTDEGRSWVNPPDTIPCAVIGDGGQHKVNVVGICPGYVQGGTLSVSSITLTAER